MSLAAAASRTAATMSWSWRETGAWGAAP